MLSLVLTGGTEAIASLRATGPRVVESVERAMLRLVIELQRYVILNKLEGQVLHHRTGNLERATVYDEPENNGNVISATVGVTGLAPYGKIHEYGGTVDVRESMRVSKLGNPYFVRGHRATYPERSFLRTSLAENEEHIQESIQRAVNEAL
jgi:hypothetical protein